MKRRLKGHIGLRPLFAGFNRPERLELVLALYKNHSFKLGVRTKSSINRARVLRVCQEISITLRGRVALHVLQKLK